MNRGSEIPYRQIHLLDEDTINQIAAGEVVERPASIVKELVENALDAQATDITIAIQTDRHQVIAIAVTDDGLGMLPEEVPLAFMPHATSKILTAEDLNRCSTLGFRGEALASIASVACVTLKTRPRPRSYASPDKGGTGFHYIISAGEVLTAGETGSAIGTSITVENIFFNIPARKKFQKTVSTETARIADTIEGFAILYPSVTFRYRLNGAEKISTHGCSALGEVLYALYPHEMQNMIPLTWEEEGVNITGFISQPSMSRKNGRRIILAVNNRKIISQPIQQAIKKGYSTLLMTKEYPIAVLHLTLDPAGVDVNVHPTKREVRFLHESTVLTALTTGVRNTLSLHNLIPVGDAKPVFPTLPDFRILQKTGIKTDTPTDTHTSSYQDTYHFEQERLVPDYTGDGVYEVTAAQARLSQYRLRQTQLPLTGSIPIPTIPSLVYIGQIDATYIVASTSEGGMLLIDQHAAHERIRYDQLLLANEGKSDSQELIVPIILTLSIPEAAIMQKALFILFEQGFIIESFGRDSYQIRAVPVLLGKNEESDTIHEILDTLIEEGIKKPELIRDTVLKMVACRGAIKAGTILTPDLGQELLDQLVKTASPYTCPHGRPTMIQFPASHLQKLFQRI